VSALRAMAFRSTRADTDGFTAVRRRVGLGPATLP
jgi:hypothetical protein